MCRITLIILALLLAGPAHAWVFYQREFGDWLVVCWSSAEGSNDPLCSLSAPIQSLGSPTPNILHVQEFAPDAYQVAIEMRGGDPQPYAPVWLKTDAFPAHETPVTGDWGRWADGDALRIVSEMRASARLTYRVRLAPNGRPQDTEVSLVGFRAALDAYRTEIRRHKILTPTR